VTLPRTPAQTVGPFYSIGLCRRPENELVGRDEPGALELAGRLFDGEGTPVVDGLIEVWDRAGRRWGRSGTDADGRFAFVLTKPDAAPGEAPRLDVWVHARGLLRQLLTRIYFAGEDANTSDPVLAQLAAADAATLVAQAEDGGLRFDVHLQGERATTFFAH